MQGVLWAFMSFLSWGQRSGEVSIPVRLFESKCTLSGPKARFSASDLAQIHELSPERVLTFTTADAAQASLIKLTKLKPPTPELEAYVSQARTYAERVSQFLEGTEALRADKNREKFLSALSGKLTRRQKTHLEEIAGRVLAGEETDILIASFGETLGAAPDEEFHRSIRRMKINYNCVFDRGR